MIIDGKTVEINSIVKFKSMNNYDSNLWQGTVVAFGSAEVAKNFTDIYAYHQNILRSVREQFETGTGAYIEADALSYFVIRCLDNVIRAFAVEWISPSSLEIIDTTTNITVKIYNVHTTSIDNIINLLKDNGFVARQIS